MIIERKLLYAIAKIGKKDKIIKDDYFLINETLSELINVGNNIDLLQTAIDQMNQYGDITADTMEKILNTGNVDMIALLGDRNTFTSGATDLLNQYMQEKENTKNQIIQAAIDEKEGIRSVTNEIDNANNSLTEFKSTVERNEKKKLPLVK